jgi:hypothetical protein
MYKIICALLLCTFAAFADDVSGTWQITVETNQGSGTPTLDLKQTGEQLTGTYHSQILGDAKVTGTIKGNAIEFAFVGDAGGQQIKVTYKGTLESATAMKGTAVYEGLDDKATWSASKK